MSHTHSCVGAMREFKGVKFCIYPLSAPWKCMTKPCHKATKVQRIKHVQGYEAPKPWVGPAHRDVANWERKPWIPFILSHPVKTHSQYLVFPPLASMHASTLFYMLAYKLSTIKEGRFWNVLKIGFWNSSRALQPMESTLFWTNDHTFPIGLKSGLLGGYPRSNFRCEQGHFSPQASNLP